MIAIIPIPGFSEPVSSLTHLLGAGAFALLSVLLLRRGRRSEHSQHRRLRMWSLAVFCLGTVLLLSMSGIYHLLEPGSSTRAVLRRLDHAAIFVLIASSFTPVHIILFRGWARWGVLALIWAYAAVAISFKTVYFNEIPVAVGLLLYLGMGWFGLGTGIALWSKRGFRFIEPLVFGGLAYSIGAVLDFLNGPVLWSGVFESHELFHVAVLIGLAFHWSFIYAIADGGYSQSVDPGDVLLPTLPKS